MAQREREPMKSFLFLAPEDLLDKSRVIAADRGIPLSAFLREALEMLVRWAGNEPPD